jgi:cell division protein ZapE
VHDIADAMLLHGLLDELIKNNVTLVFTSNIPSEELYKDGIQRDNFLPAIDLIKNNTTELCLNGIKDYRKDIITENKIYYLLPEESAYETLNSYINELSPTAITYYSNIVIHDRKINVIAITDGVVWLDFNELFRTARSSADYLEIARMFHTVLVSNVQVMKEEDDNPAKRFIHFIDALYDHNVKVIMNAEDSAENIYTGKRLAFAFERTISRLTEMGTERYLLLPHITHSGRG